MKCQHGQERMDYSALSFREAEEESERTGIPNDHPLPPYCRCCGDVCMLGATRCDTCRPKEEMQ